MLLLQVDANQGLRTLNPKQPPGSLTSAAHVVRFPKDARMIRSEALTGQCHVSCSCFAKCISRLCLSALV